jgi:hypothetical protein
MPYLNLLEPAHHLPGRRVGQQRKLTSQISQVPGVVDIFSAAKSPALESAFTRRGAGFELHIDPEDWERASGEAVESVCLHEEAELEEVAVSCASPGLY